MSDTTTQALDSAYASAVDNTITKGAGKVMDKQAFLMLLVTQFKYQDPLNPMEDKEFVAQLAQFSGLEQSMNMNENLGKLIGIQEQQMVIGAANYIGRDVSARGYGVSVEKGDASLVQYATSEAMASGYVNILDTNSKTILATIDLGRQSASIHDFKWDGKRADGSTAPDGVYTVSFVAYNAQGDRIMVDTSITGKVEGVSSYNNEQYLRLSDGRTVLLSNVREIVDASKAANASGATEEEKKTDAAEDAEDSLWEKAKAKFLEWIGADEEPAAPATTA